MAGAYSGYLAEFARAAARDAGLHLQRVYMPVCWVPRMRLPPRCACSIRWARLRGLLDGVRGYHGKGFGHGGLGCHARDNKAGMIDNSHEDALKAAEKAAAATQSVLKGTISYLGGH